MKGIKIEFLGAASTGKSTLINAIASCYPQFKIQTESVRYLKQKYGLDFNSGSTALQMAILSLQLKYANNPEDYLLDRSSTNSQSYINYYTKKNNCDMTPATRQFIYDEGKKNAKENIDLIVFLRPGDFPTVEDGTRITDSDYIKETDAEMVALIKEWGLEDKVVECHGSVIERIETLKPYIDKLIKERSRG